MSETLDLEALARVGLGPRVRRQLACGIADPSARPMRVTQVQREHLLLHDGRRAYRAQAAPALVDDLDAQQESLAVGDWVLAQPGGASSWRITCRLPPANQITRRTQDSRAGDDRRRAQRQVLVSNVDTALLVMGLDADFNLRRLERYLALTRLAGVSALLLLSKADTVAAALRDQQIDAARTVLPAGMPVLALDLRQPAVAQALTPWLQPGQTLVLLGSSGAGKSTLANSLCAGAGPAPGPAPTQLTGPAPGPAPTQLTGPVPGPAPTQLTGPSRADDSRGRHTTTVRSLLLLPGGACLIDTPGLRALRLDLAEPDDLARAFGEVAGLAPLCRFRNCQHQAEPGCAVRVSVDAPRLHNFHKLLRKARRDTLSPVERQAEVARFKARGRATRLRMRIKREGV